MLVRNVELRDMTEVMELERALWVDPDFGRLPLPWALKEEGMISLIRQRTDPDRGTFATRTFVVEDDEVIQGALVYERQADALEVVWFAVHPDACVESTIWALSELLKRESDGKKVVLHLHDRDEAGLRELLPAWKREGFSCQLSPDYFTTHDGWRMTWKTSPT